MQRERPAIRRLCGRVAAALLLTGVAVVPTIAASAEPPFASPWVADHATRVRLVAGPASVDGSPARLVAGIEIELDAAWKTYWRNPGSSGVPPRIEWTGSENLTAATVLYPAPERFPDRDGDTIGYKQRVLLPVELKAADPKAPVRLKLSLEYGVCKDVCIPVQPTLELTLPPGAAAATAAPAPLLQDSLDAVPRAPGVRATDPAVRAVRIDTRSDKPSIEIEAAFPGGGKADVFLEAPDGLWIPLAKPAGDQSGPNRTFHVDLTDGADIADLKGRMIRLTLVSSRGATDTSFKFE